MSWFVLAVIVMAGLGYFTWQKSQAQIKALEQTGFVITKDLKGEPRLLVNAEAEQLAIVSPTAYEVHPLASIVSPEVIFDRGVQMDQNFRIKLSVQGRNPATLEIRYENETLARSALEALNSALQ